VHDFSWDAKGENFIVISGFMPSHSVMFNEQNKQVFEFGVSHRNKIIWGNLGRFLCLAGFGNLNGEMEIWDLQTKTKIGVCKSNSASHCDWAPDDRKLITSIVTPRLRVDNCYKIFSYTGTMIHKANYEDTELYEAIFSKNDEYNKH
jgi:translation initiation factor 2A